MTLWQSIAAGCEFWNFSLQQLLCQSRKVTNFLAWSPIIHLTGRARLAAEEKGSNNDYNLLNALSPQVSFPN